MSTITTIGSGFSSLASAITLADQGHDVTLLEKNSTPGGRARKFEKDGFVFDMGPSWYWMPEVFEEFFNRFGKSTKDYFNLVRLDPSYRVWFEDEQVDIPASFDELVALFESREKGAGDRLIKFINDAKIKYEAGMHDLVWKPGLSVFEFAKWKVLKGLVQLDLLKSFHAFARKYFSDPKLLQIIEFPVLFLGAMPQETPALYSLMNYADLKLGTWYPMGGMHKIIEAMTSLAEEKGVKLRMDEEVKHIYQNGKMNVQTLNSQFASDYVVGGADYHHIESNLLDQADRQYSDPYWENKTMSPSCLLYYVGVNKRVDNLKHHNLFFDADFDKHAQEIYKTKEWPKSPLFYVCAPSKTDDSVAPEGHENLFILIPIASGLTGDDEELRKMYFDLVLERLESKTGVSIRENIVYNRSYSVSEFSKDYNAFKGNAYGLANTLMQTAFLKPRIRSKKLPNLFYTGQLTVPGPGVPPSLISGQLVADYINNISKSN